jgi:hypothetical protein
LILNVAASTSSTESRKLRHGAAADGWIAIHERGTSLVLEDGDLKALLEWDRAMGETSEMSAVLPNSGRIAVVVTTFLDDLIGVLAVWQNVATTAFFFGN